MRLSTMKLISRISRITQKYKGILFVHSRVLNDNELWFPVHLELCLNHGSQMC